MRNEENTPSLRRTRLLGERPGAFAIARYVRMSPTKVRRVVDMVRGMDALVAEDVLKFAPQAASEPVLKVLKSAVQNAEENEGLDAGTLYVSKAFVDEGVTLRRIRARAKGSAARILKRGAHITVVVEPREEQVVAPATKASAKTKAPAKTKAAKAAPATQDSPTSNEEA
ncbi:MAG: 50S ribosomal protein L22 [Propionibacteriaceae bacterium]|nr:50S ribosomal protein L22 [Propionibacteriaceae bacterium]